MARNESNREDLFAEAVALEQRCELIIPGSDNRIVAGFRRDGVLVVYFDADHMLQLDLFGRVRRAFLNGCLYRAEHNGLSRLVRRRSAEETTLLRHDLTPAELMEFRREARTRMQLLAGSIAEQRIQVRRQEPSNSRELLSDIRVRLERAIAAEHWIAPPIK